MLMYFFSREGESYPVPPLTVKIPATFRMTSLGEVHPDSWPRSLTPMTFGHFSSQGMSAMTSTASAPPTPIQRPPRPPPFGVWESVPTIKRPEECKSCWPLQLIMLSTVGSPYPDFQKTRPRLLCFVNRTNHIRNLGGLVIQKTKPNPVFFRITRPFLNISERVSISGQIQVNWDEFRIKRPPRWIRFETPLYFFNLNTSVLNVGSCMPRD